MHVQLAFHQTLLNSRSVRFGELVRAEELSNFLNRADSSVISTEEVSKILGWKVQNKRLLGALFCSQQPAADHFGACPGSERLWQQRSMQAIQTRDMTLSISVKHWLAVADAESGSGMICSAVPMYVNVMFLGERARS